MKCRETKESETVYAVEKKWPNNRCRVFDELAIAVCRERNPRCLPYLRMLGTHLPAITHRVRRLTRPDVYVVGWSKQDSRKGR